MTCKLHSSISMQPPTLGISEDKRLPFLPPSFLLAKATNQLQIEISIEKFVRKHLNFTYLAPFCSSANSSNTQNVTKHWGLKAEEET